MATNNAINAANPIGIASGGINASSLTTTDGVIYYDGTRLVTTAAGTAAQVLTSNGAGVAPTYQTAPTINGYLFHTGSGDASATAAGAITIAGTTNQITTSGASATVTVALATSVTTVGSLTAGTSITATAGNVTVTSGKVKVANSTSTVGIIKFNALNYFHNFGTRNIFGGHTSGNFTLSGADNTCFGNSDNTATNGPMKSATTAARNSIFGERNIGNAITSGSDITAFGYAVSSTITTGSKSTGFGDSCSRGTTGDQNIGLGLSGGISWTVADNSNIALSNTGTAGDTHKIKLGTPGSSGGQVNKCFIAGITGVTIVGSAVIISTVSTQLGTIVSSLRYKNNIEDMNTDSEFIFKLRPICFNFIADKNKTKQYGLIAEEVYKIAPDMVIYSDPNPIDPIVFDEEHNPIFPIKKPQLPLQIESVKYHDLSVILLNEIQKQATRIQDLINRIVILKNKLGV